MSHIITLNLLIASHLTHKVHKPACKNSHASHLTLPLWSHSEHLSCCSGLVTLSSSLAFKYAKQFPVQGQLKVFLLYLDFLMHFHASHPQFVLFSPPKNHFINSSLTTLFKLAFHPPQHSLSFYLVFIFSLYYLPPSVMFHLPDYW